MILSLYPYFLTRSLCGHLQLCRKPVLLELGMQSIWQGSYLEVTNKADTETLSNSIFDLATSSSARFGQCSILE